MINYQEMAATARRLLRENGTKMALRRTPQQTYDPSTGTAQSQPSVDLPTFGAFQRRSRFYQVTGRGVGGVQRVDNVLMQERTVIIDATQTPQLNDYLVTVADGQVWQILDIEEKSPSGVPLAYVLTVRR